MDGHYLGNLTGLAHVPRDGIEVELRHVGRCRFPLMRRPSHFYTMFSVNV